MSRLIELQVAVSDDDHGRTTAVISVVGEFDRLQTVRFDTAAAALPSPLGALTIDLRGTTIIDSAALGSLVRLRRTADERGCRMVVLVARPFQVTVMKVGGLFDHLGVEVVQPLTEPDN